MPEEISIEIRKAILEQELETHLALRYRLEVRARVNKKIGADPGTLKAIVDDLERVEMAINEYRQELGELE